VTLCAERPIIRPVGVVRLSCVRQKGYKAGYALILPRRVLPSARRLGSKNPERRPRDEVALKVEVIVDGGMHAEEALGGRSS
jgi:hypothetical protein